MQEIESFFKRSHKVIVALTVQEILDEYIAKKLSVCIGRAWQVYLQQKNYDQAEIYLLQAADKAPATPPAINIWLNLTELYLAEGKFDPARQWAQKLVDSGQGGEQAKRLLRAAQENRQSIE